MATQYPCSVPQQFSRRSACGRLRSPTSERQAHRDRSRRARGEPDAPQRRTEHPQPTRPVPHVHPAPAALVRDIRHDARLDGHIPIDRYDPRLGRVGVDRAWLPFTLNATDLHRSSAPTPPRNRRSPETSAPCPPHAAPGPLESRAGATAGAAGGGPGRPRSGHWLDRVGNDLGEVDHDRLHPDADPQEESSRRRHGRHVEIARPALGHVEVDAFDRLSSRQRVSREVLRAGHRDICSDARAWMATGRPMTPTASSGSARRVTGAARPFRGPRPRRDRSRTRPSCPRRAARRPTPARADPGCAARARKWLRC